MRASLSWIFVGGRGGEGERVRRAEVEVVLRPIVRPGRKASETRFAFVRACNPSRAAEGSKDFIEGIPAPW